jgi:acyl-coenzyme A synthetase/AMP-(fatty) acid ligase
VAAQHTKEGITAIGIIILESHVKISQLNLLETVNQALKDKKQPSLSNIITLNSIKDIPKGVTGKVLKRLIRNNEKTQIQETD